MSYKNYVQWRVIFTAACVVLLCASLVSQVNAAAYDDTLQRLQAFIRKYPDILLPNIELHVDGKVYAIEDVDGKPSVRQGTLTNPRFKVYTSAKTLNYLLSSNGLIQFSLRLKFSLKTGTIKVESVAVQQSKQLESEWPEGYIVTGEVKKIESRWENDLIYSYVTLSVSDVRRGPEDLRGKDIVIKHAGGGIGDKVLWQSDQPAFMVGETVVVNLRMSKGLQVFTVIDGAKGKVSLSSEPEPIDAFTAAGYKLYWYKPGVGWTTATTRPGDGWYGPLKWEAMPVSWYIDQSTPYSGISWTTFETYGKKCYQVWEDDTASTVDYTYIGFTSGKSWGSNDGINIFCWRYIDGPGNVLAQANMWGQTVAPDRMKITDADVRLDTGDSWSAADACPGDKFDVQNVGTHEVGHVTGLADIYDAADADMTMYGYASPGETKKRTLAWGDQDGLYALYPGCFIVTAAYGSELSNEVQFLRAFRDQVAIDTFIGVEGVSLFNQIYFSFSPNVAQFIQGHSTIRAIAKTLLYPLVGIIHLAAASYSSLSFNTELSVTVAALLTSGLIGAIYCTPLALLIIALVKRHNMKTLKIARLKLFIAPWLISLLLIGLAIMTLSSPLVKTAVSILALTTAAISAAGTALILSKGFSVLRCNLRSMKPKGIRSSPL